MYNYAGVFIWVCPALCCDCVLLLAHWFSYVHITVLEDSSSVSEDEVYGAIDVTVSVELALGVDVECVLVTLETTLVEHREVGPGSESHCLMLLWSGRVLERHAFRNKSASGDRC